MANLGSDDTPIVGESFGLPSGWSITENADGEVVIEDSGANVVFRRDETVGEWVTDSIDAESVSVEQASINQVAAKVFNENTDTSVDNQDTTEVDWDTQGFEDDDVAEIDLDNNQITIQESGTYLLTAIITWQSSSNWSTGDRVRLIPEINGSELPPFIDRARKVGTESQSFDHTNIAKLSENDNVSISLWQDSGETQEILSGGTRNGFMIARLG